ncbi:CAP domain-containing protein [Tepidiforma sp.]|uniref:CAP domain-containing protein n=1 Tax=Tepidiforma sp. TaxID=2682230 RepID=UPI002ADD5C40|nr:CAP domain-containing protein [Tepidiforma sp.]
MRKVPLLPVFLSGAALCSALGLWASVRGPETVAASNPALEMSADPAPVHADVPLPVTDVTPAPDTPTPTPEPAPVEVAPAVATPTPQAPAPAESPPPSAVAALPAAVSQPVELQPDTDKARTLLDLMNAARAEQGLPPLAPDDRLVEVALARARDLVANNYFDHYGPDGSSAFSELALRGIRYALAGENLARNNYIESRTVDAAFQGLMGSPGHRANILEPRFSRAGVAAVRSGRVWLYVTVFMD